METPASRAAASGGRPLGTEGPSVLPRVQTGDGSAGEAFAAEVARAERARGGERQQERLDELEGMRRDARRAGFGREREREGEEHAMEAVFRGEHAPVRAEPASAAPLSAEETTPATVEGAAVQPSAPRAEARPAAPVDPVLQAGTASLPSQTAASAAVLHSTPQLPQLANAQAPASELQPLEPASLARPGSRPVKAASPPPPPAGPDAAVLERAAEILRQIQLHATPHVRRLTLELEPAELGRLSVQLALRTGRVAAIVRGENPETLALLEQHEAGLRDVLAQRGIAADAVRFELGFGGQRSRRGAGAPSPVQSTSSSSATTSSSTPPREHASRIDLVA